MYSSVHLQICVDGYWLIVCKTLNVILQKKNLTFVRPYLQKILLR